MLKTTVAGKKYARALYSITQDRGITDKIKEEMISVKKVFNDEPKIQKILEQKQIPFYDKQKLISNVFGSSLSQISLGVLTILLKRGRILLLGEIIDEFCRMIAAEKGELKVEVKTALKISESSKRELSKALSDITGAKVSLDVHIDETIIGGIVVRIGDKVIDGSIKGELANLRKKIRAAKVGA